MHAVAYRPLQTAPAGICSDAHDRVDPGGQMPDHAAANHICVPRALLKRLVQVFQNRCGRLCVVIEALAVGYQNCGMRRRLKWVFTERIVA